MNKDSNLSVTEYPSIDENDRVDDLMDTHVTIETSDSSGDREFKIENSEETVTIVSVDDVAAYILEKLGKITSIKLQKLVYYCQAWSLVWDEESLFPERIEAWANGPVVPSLFYKHKGLFLLDNNVFSLGNPRILSQKQKDTINAVLAHYGDKSAQWLVELSHLEDPWRNARKGIPEGVHSNREISLDEMAMYYGSL